LICTLDGDDLALPTFVSKGVEKIAKGEANLVCCNVEVFGDRSTEWVPNDYRDCFLRYDNSIPTLVLYEKKIWERTGGYKRAFPFVEDWEFFINATRFGLDVYRIPEKLFRYRAVAGGLAEIF